MTTPATASMEGIGKGLLKGRQGMQECRSSDTGTTGNEREYIVDGCRRAADAESLPRTPTRDTLAMVKITTTYEGGLRCRATHGPSGTTLVTDAPVDNHGRGESFSPTDLVATALGACMMTIMGIAAERHAIDLKGMTVETTKEMTSAPPRRIASLRTTLTIPLPPDHPHRQLLEQAAHTCPVHKSIHPEIAAPIEFVWTG